MNLDRIRADIKTAQNNISSRGNPSNDEYMYDVSAYHVQQAVEKELKYILHDRYGLNDTEKRFRTHNISTLIIMVSSHDSTFIANHPELISISDRLTEWEASTRYGESLVAVKNEIDKALGIAIDLLDEIQTKYVKQIPNEDKEDKEYMI